MSGKHRITKISLKDGTEIKIYAGSRVSDALDDVMDDMTLYQGVRLSQVLEAVYAQGRKDGARDAFEHVRAGFEVAEATVPHKLPGRPRKRARRKK